MEFKKLERNNTKKVLLVLVVLIAIITTVVSLRSRAKYQVTKSAQIVNGVINYKPYDFMIVEIQKENDTGGYEITDKVPTTGYEIDESQSKCMIDDTHEDTGAVLKTIGGNHTFSKLKKRDKCTLYFKIKPITITELVNSRNPQQGQTSFSSTDTSEHKDSNGNSIMYSGTDDNGTTYYFRGKVDDNWVRYGTTSDNKSIWWRIIRINGDGTIRLIYAGTTTLNSTTPPGTTGTGTQITVGSANTFYYATSDGKFNDNKYVGYQYADSNVHGKGTNSYAADRANEWFKTNLLDEWSNGNGKIDNNAGFCADRTSYTNNTGTTTGGGTGTTTTYYAPYIRFYKGGSWQNPQAPIFTCTNKEDLFTYGKAEKGTQSLTYPVGLITADEVVYAGGFGGSNNQSYYLYTNSAYWTMSPYKFSGTYAYVFYVNLNGNLTFGSENSAYGVRPVINLKADTTFTGNGKSGSPFVPS